LLSDVKEWSDPDEVHRQFERVLPKEIRQRTSLLGPHRDDLLFLLNGQDARAFASQGQCRSIVLALKLGVMELLEKRWEDPPIILLDDVDAELDTVRSNRFFEMILNADRQVFISCTDAYRGILRSHQSSLVYRVDDGLYAPEKSCG
jgi:DNA replication and repair protein RecF